MTVSKNINKITPIDFVPVGSFLSFLEITKAGTHNTSAKALYRCEKCGTIKEIAVSNVKRGSTKSCGCYSSDYTSRTKHGLCKHPLYNIWHHIKMRCHNPKDGFYKHYGAKGVKMCDEWMNNPEKFIKWALNSGWTNELYIDKDIIPFKLGIPALLYSPEMCSIVTREENDQYRRHNVFLEFNGERLTIAQWSRKTGIKHNYISNRISKGWSVADALTVPIKKYNK